MSQLPIHPMMVHFPIALLLAALAIDGVGLVWKKDNLRFAALPVLALAVLGAAAAAITGDMAHDKILRMSSELHELIETHEAFAIATLVVSIVALGLKVWAEYKKAMCRLWGRLAFAALCIAAILVGITGYYGGEVVFKYGAGTALYDKANQAAPMHGEEHVK